MGGEPVVLGRGPATALLLQARGKVSDADAKGRGHFDIR